MTGFVLGLAGLFSALVWLTMLVVTSFSLAVVGVGLLAALYVLNSSTDHTRNSARTRSTVSAVAVRTRSDGIER